MEGFVKWSIRISTMTLKYIVVMQGWRGRVIESELCVISEPEEGCSQPWATGVLGDLCWW